jgi:hypothetical protein
MDAFFGALEKYHRTTSGFSMRQSLATTFSLTRVPAVAIGLMLMPLVTSAVAAAPETGGASAAPSTASPPAIELQEDEASKASQCAAQPCPTGPDVASERAYLVTTSHPGGTMMRQGPELAIARLHPEFATRLAAAIREARASGLSETGIFSAYRPPAFGVGGFKDKFHSLHSYGLAVDMHGIGAPGSSEARLWRSIAAKHGVTCPYGVDNKAEWNHCQPTSIKMVRSDSPLVKTISPEGPVNPLNMFEAGKQLIESVAKLLASFGGAPGSAQIDDKAVTIAAHRGRRVRIADAGSARQQRNERQRVAGKGQKTKPVRTAASGKTVRTATSGKTVRTAVSSKTHMARQAGHGARKGRGEG